MHENTIHVYACILLYTTQTMHTHMSWPEILSLKSYRQTSIRTHIMNAHPPQIQDTNTRVCTQTCAETHKHTNALARSYTQTQHLQVAIDYPVAGNYTIEVSAHKLFRDARPQPYALTVGQAAHGSITVSLPESF